MLQLVVVTVSLVAVYRQLRLQASASAFSQLNAFEAEWGGERFSRYRLQVLTAIRDGTAPEDLPYPPAFRLGLYWDKVAALVRGGHVDARLLWSGSGTDCYVWWLILRHWIEGQRRYPHSSPTYDGFEWLAGRMHEISRREGLAEIDDDWIASTIATRIETNLETIRVEQSVRTVMLESTNGATPGTTDGIHGQAPGRSPRAPRRRGRDEAPCR